MLRFEKDQKGLKLILDQYSQEAVEPYRSMLQAANVSFIEGQTLDPKYHTPTTYFKVEAADMKTVAKLIGTWATCFDDINHAVPII